MNDYMDWNKLLSSKRLNSSEEESSGKVSRTPFKRDYGRVLYSSAYRRLQDKTQVFPLGRNDYVRTRLTHSQEVANVGSVLARSLADFVVEQDSINESEKCNFRDAMDDIVVTACLAHDIGNPPFGHSGENAINKAVTSFLSKCGKEFLHPDELPLEKSGDHFKYKFEGNAQGFRILTRLCDSSRGSLRGLDLTTATLAAFTKYPRTLTEANSINLKKFGINPSEKEIFKKVAHECGLITSQGQVRRHPLAFLMEAADDISYLIADIEDAYISNIIDYEVAMELLGSLCGESNLPKKPTSLGERLTNIRLARSKAINNCIQKVVPVMSDSYSELMKGTLPTSLILSSELCEKYKSAKQYSINNIYNHESVLRVEITGFKVIGDLFDLFSEWILAPNEPLSDKLCHILHPRAEIISNPILRLQHVIDYISGMTDSFALQTYKNLTGVKSV